MDESAEKEIFRDLCQEAAEYIRSADIFLFSTGAGWSADSGLPVYKDIANFPTYKDLNLTYKDVSQPHWLKTHPEMFYGFWGTCFNSYRDTKHHPGYSIIHSWRTKYFSKIENFEEDGNNNHNKKTKNLEILKDKQISCMMKHKDRHEPPCMIILNNNRLYPAFQFFNYTSNVDGHSLRVFNKNEVFQIHGNTEHGNAVYFLIFHQKSKPGSVCGERGTWELQENFRFVVDSGTNLAYEESCIKESSGIESNWPVCIHCKEEKARPAVLMFEDFGCIPNYCEEQRYLDWKKNVQEIVRKSWEDENVEEKGNLKVVVLEIGCGMNVQTVRGQSHSWLRNLPGGSVSLIRINPDYPEIVLCEDELKAKNNILSIKAKGLETVQMIDQFM